MIVTCSKCSTRFKIADEKISDSGVKVRCSKCKHTFIVSTDGVKEMNLPAALPSGIPPPPREMPLPPPPKIVNTNPPSKPREEKKITPPVCDDETLPNDIFASPTKVGPAPEGTGGTFKPLPPPLKSSPSAVNHENESLPALEDSPTKKVSLPQGETFGLIESAAVLSSDSIDSIDLDSDLPIFNANSLPSASGHNASQIPEESGSAQQSKNPVLSEDLFSDLDSAVDQLAPLTESVSFPSPNEGSGLSRAEEAKAIPSAAVSSSNPVVSEPDLVPDDPFAEIDINIPAAIDKPMAVHSSLPEESAPAFSVDDPFADMGVDSGIEQDSSVQKEQKEDQIFSDPFSSLPLEQNQQQDHPANNQAAGPLSAAADSGGDLFSDLGDPFEGLNEQAPTAAPPPLPPQSADESVPESSSSQDLFGLPPALELAKDDQQSTALPPGQDLSVGHDPFAGMENVDSFSTEDQQLDMGPAIGSDGKIQGEEPPSGPLPTKVLGSGEQQDKPAPVELNQAPVQPPMLTTPSDGPAPGNKSSLLFKLVFGLVLLSIAFFAFVAFRHGGKPDLTKWSTYVEAFTGADSTFATNGDLQVVDVASTSYRNTEGHQLVVLWGTIRNNGTKKKKQLVVTGQLLLNGKPISKLSVPVGVVFTPSDVFSMLDDIAIKEAYVQNFNPDRCAIGPGLTAPFMIILSDHPDKLAGLKVRVIPDQSDDPLSGVRTKEASTQTSAQESKTPPVTGQTSSAGKKHKDKPAAQKSAIANSADGKPKK